MDSKLDFSGLAAALLVHARMLVVDWLPGGSMSGHEYVCADLRGGPGRSLSVNVETGKWADFSGDVRGGDLISLYAAIHDIKQGSAARELAEKIGYSLGHDQPYPKKEKASRITAPPPELPEPDMTHVRFGSPSMRWIYRDESGAVLFYIARYDTEGEERSKQYVPFCWDADLRKWVMKAWPKPRPVYGLELLSLRPDDPVLIVEGEKAADAARDMIQNYVVVSWPGGAAAWKHVDWSTLHGRRLLMWPDADRHVAKDETEAKKYGCKVGDIIPYEHQPGPAAMSGIAAILHGQTQEIKIINVGIDEVRENGWDAADAAAAGWSWENFSEWAKPRLTLFGPASVPIEIDQIISPDAPPPELAELNDSKPKGRTLYAEWERLGVATAQNGSPICNQDNALRVIEKREEFKDLLWYDDFHKRYLTKFNFNTFQHETVREWSDIDELNLTAFMQRQLGLRRMSDEMVHKAAVVYAHHHERNEPRDWMESIKWDGTPRIEDFFTTHLGVVGSRYVGAASKNFWIGMIARIYWPGCQLDNMIVLEGPQGAGKTRALRAIGGPWYTEVKENVTHRDFFMVLHGKLLVEIAELDAFRKAEITRIKQVVTCATDRFRSPYDRAAKDHARMSVFVGSTNESNYLSDNTGARRFWPMRCGTIKVDKIAEDREQLFAEAVERYKKREPWHEMPIDETAKEQEDRRHVDEWENIVAEYLANQEQTTTRDIAGYLKIETAKLDMITQKRIAGVLRVLGWEKKTARSTGGATIKVWRKAGEPEELPLPETAADQTEPF